MAKFYSSDSDNFVNEIVTDGISNAPTNPEDIAHVYELGRCLSWLEETGATKVCLQFPDTRLIDSVPVCQWFQQQDGGRTFYILGDTSYGSCCVDVVAAEHIPADAIIHFGPACLSYFSAKEAKSAVPVLYVFPKVDNVDVMSIANNISQHLKPLENVLLICSCELSASQGEICDAVQQVSKGVIINSRLLTGEQGEYANASSKGKCGDHCQLDTGTSHQILCLGRSFCLPKGLALEQCNVVYVGEENAFLHALFASGLQNCKTFTCISSDGTQFTPALDISRIRRRQCYLVQHVREASIIVLVLASPGDPSLLPAVKYIRQLIATRNPPPRLYTLAVGKPNPAKLANFMEADVFVLLACPQHPLLAPASSQQLRKDYYKPVVGLAEVEMAFNSARFAAGTDFHSLLPGEWDHMDIQPCATSAADTDISLLTGNLLRRGADLNEGQDGTVAEKVFGQLTATGAAKLSDRSWTGLDPQLGQTEVTKVVAGRSGVASHYSNEEK